MKKITEACDKTIAAISYTAMKQAEDQIGEQLGNLAIQTIYNGYVDEEYTITATIQVKVSAQDVLNMVDYIEAQSLPTWQQSVLPYLMQFTGE